MKIDAFPADEVKMGLSLCRDGGPKKVVIKILKENWLGKSPKFARFKMLEVISETPLN